ncbi:RNA polymerase sigma factor [Candidatus Omnitrophota bacterium]
MSQDEAHLKFLIERYQQRVFALVLYMIGNDKNKTYELTASSFVKALRSASVYEEGEAFLIRVLGVAIDQSRDVKAMPSVDESSLEHISPARRPFFKIITLSLQALPFEIKAVLLLRDQAHLTYKGISTVLGISESEARIQTLKAREQLKEQIKEVLSRGG